MMDGRFDQHFLELFATSVDDEAKEGRLPSRLPLVFANVLGLAVCACAALLG
jgi:hypothetical protein